jgi:hypothetical protein
MLLTTALGSKWAGTVRGRTPLSVACSCACSLLTRRSSIRNAHEDARPTTKGSAPMRTLWWLETHRGDADSNRSVAAIRR